MSDIERCAPRSTGATSCSATRSGSRSNSSPCFADGSSSRRCHRWSPAIAGDQDVSEVLASLVDQSMVVADGADPARFRMLEPLRQYAAERLSRTDRAEIVATRHARYYAQLAKRLDDQLGGRDEMIAARRIDAARDNLRAAFHTAARDSDVANALAIGVALTRYAGTRIWSEPWSWCEAALTLPGAADHPLRPDALVGRERRCLAARRPHPQCGTRRRGHRPRRAGQPRMA